MNSDRQTPTSLRYFTPELYLRLNSPDEFIASEASDEWEDANTRYFEHLATILTQMPDPVREIAEFACFHDTKIIELAFPSTDSSNSSFSTQILVENEAKSRTRLTYIGGREPAQHKLQGFHTDTPVQWVVDEFEIDEPTLSQFLHRIMLSDGREIEIPFFDIKRDKETT